MSLRRTRTFALAYGRETSTAALLLPPVAGSAVAAPATGPTIARVDRDAVPPAPQAPPPSEVCGHRTQTLVSHRLEAPWSHNPECRARIARWRRANGDRTPVAGHLEPFADVPASFGAVHLGRFTTPRGGVFAAISADAPALLGIGALTVLVRELGKIRRDLLAQQDARHPDGASK